MLPVAWDPQLTGLGRLARQMKADEDRARGNALLVVRAGDPGDAEADVGPCHPGGTFGHGGGGRFGDHRSGGHPEDRRT